MYGIIVVTHIAALITSLAQRCRYFSQNKPEQERSGYVRQRLFILDFAKAVPQRDTAPCMVKRTVPLNQVGKPRAKPKAPRETVHIVSALPHPQYPKSSNNHADLIKPTHRVQTSFNTYMYVHAAYRTCTVCCTWRREPPR